MTRKLSSADNNYRSGTLSVFPGAKDSKLTLHEARNNAESQLRQTLAINGKYLVLSDADTFPDSGIIKITSKNSQSLLDSHEVIFYARKIGNQLHMLQRGYGDTSPNTLPAGSKVSCPVMAEHHNAIKDAIINIQRKIGLEKNPMSDSINGILSYLENTWLAPKPNFKGYPRKGVVPLTVTFHNFSTGHKGRYLWDFGDGNTSTEANPIHTYHSEGNYKVRLTMTTEGGAQGLSEKSDYINVNTTMLTTVFYFSPFQGDIKTEFTFIDQSEGEITERHWYFGDGKDQTITGHMHSVVHIYEKPGVYKPSLIVRLNDNTTRKTFAREGIIIT